MDFIPLADGLDARRTLHQTLRNLGLLDSLELCLDAGDIASVSGLAPTKWLDTSGNGYDFFLGTDATAEATDPTFNGMPGLRGKDEYFSFDGGDFCQYDSANETWMENLHKDNAANTLVAWINNGDLSDVSNGIWGCHNINQGQTGLVWRLDTSGAHLLTVANGTGSSWALSAVSSNAALAISDGVWSMMALSIDEAAGASGSLFFTDGSAEAFDATYTSPSAGSATQSYFVGARVASVTLSAGSQLAMFAAWSRVLSAEELSRIYQATRGRFGV